MKTVEIKWNDETYKITEKDSFEIGEILEEIIPLTEIGQMQAHPRFHKLARCYAEMINFAGGHVTASEVHKSMMEQMKDDDSAAVVIATSAISALIEILMDGAPDAGDNDVKKKIKSKK